MLDPMTLELPGCSLKSLTMWPSGQTTGHLWMARPSFERPENFGKGEAVCGDYWALYVEKEREEKKKKNRPLESFAAL